MLTQACSVWWFTQLKQVWQVCYIFILCMKMSCSLKKLPKKCRVTRRNRFKVKFTRSLLSADLSNLLCVLATQRENEVTAGSLVYSSAPVTTTPPAPLLLSRLACAGYEELPGCAHLLQANCGVEGQCWCLNRLLLTDVFTLAKIRW